MSEVLEVLKGWLCLFIWVGALCAFGGLIHLGERKARRDPEFALWWSWLKQGEKWAWTGMGIVIGLTLVAAWYRSDLTFMLVMAVGIWISAAHGCYKVWKDEHALGFYKDWQEKHPFMPSSKSEDSETGASSGASSPASDSPSDRAD